MGTCIKTCITTAKRNHSKDLKDLIPTGDEAERGADTTVIAPRLLGQSYAPYKFIDEEDLTQSAWANISSQEVDYILRADKPRGPEE